MNPSKDNGPRERAVEETYSIIWCSTDSKRTARRQHQTSHLHKCGPRCILEALIAIDAGEPLDSVLADFERLPPVSYHAAIMGFCDGGST